MADASADELAQSAPMPAATVVPLQDGKDGFQVLLLRRRGGGSFGGMWVFPGGQVDSGDESGAAGEEGEIATARRAAVREAFEETGMRVVEDDLVTLSFWLPPSAAPRRFATWFFLAKVDPWEVVIDGTEILEHRWLAPQVAIDARESGEIGLVPPTFTTLWWLARHRTAEAALRTAARRPPERFMTRPALDKAGGRVPVMLWEGDAGYADGDVSRPGPRRRLRLDPGGWRVEIQP